MLRSPLVQISIEVKVSTLNLGCSARISHSINFMHKTVSIDFPKR